MTETLIWVALAILLISFIPYWLRSLKIAFECALYAAAFVAVVGQGIANWVRRGVGGGKGGVGGDASQPRPGEP